MQEILEKSSKKCSVILARKKKQILELGRCPTSGWEQKFNWLVEVRSQLGSIQTFAVKYQAENLLYYKLDLANAVSGLLIKEHFKEITRTFRAQVSMGCSDGELCYNALLRYLDEEIHQISYWLAHSESRSVLQSAQPQILSTDSQPTVHLHSTHSQPSIRLSSRNEIRTGSRQKKQKLKRKEQRQWTRGEIATGRRRSPRRRGGISGSTHRRRSTRRGGSAAWCRTPRSS